MIEKKGASSSKNFALNLLLVIVAAFAFYQLFALGFPSGKNTTTVSSSSEAEAAAAPKVIQVDVLNGCGVSGTGQKATGLLRAAGYDVVEMGNYKTFDVKQSLVIDRSGNLDVAKKLANDLGISPNNVIQQISPEYFVTASVLIGKDFKSLHGWK
ncbi:MAG TPA: LytR C-terminal domain-containing protein [Bacteroidota bacterium]|nr:LytR C-terminal domain-containing protein [Bacteroidota bacterium]